MAMPAAPAAGPFTVVAPGRVNLIGEHTDYNDGFVLPMAIERHVTIRVVPRSDRLAVLRTTLDPAAATVDLAAAVEPVPRHWSNYPRGVLAEYLRLGYEIPGFEAEIGGTLPAGGGLSSSAALEVATATVVETLCGRRLPPLEKALLCQRAEHGFAGVPCGIMDQFAVCFGMAGHALEIDCRSRRLVRRVPLDGRLRVLVFDSRVRHDLADGEYAKRREECAEAARRLGPPTLRDVSLPQLLTSASDLPGTLFARARHVVSENERVSAFAAALEAHDWATAGRLMGESHWSLSRDYDVSCPELDRIVEIAGDIPGIHGCRMTGGGFGGCAVALVAAVRAEEAGRQLEARYREATGIDGRWFLTAAADGPQVIVS